MRCQCVGANVSPIDGMLSPVMLLIKPALLSYRCAATSCGLAEAQMLPVLFTHFLRLTIHKANYGARFRCCVGATPAIREKGHGPVGRVRDRRSRACHEAAVLAGPGKNSPRMYRNGGLPSRQMLAQNWSVRSRDALISLKRRRQAVQRVLWAGWLQRCGLLALCVGSDRGCHAACMAPPAPRSGPPVGLWRGLGRALPRTC